MEAEEEKKRREVEDRKKKVEEMMKRMGTTGSPRGSAATRSPRRIQGTPSSATRNNNNIEEGKEESSVVRERGIKEEKGTETTTNNNANTNNNNNDEEEKRKQRRIQVERLRKRVAGQGELTEEEIQKILVEPTTLESAASSIATKISSATDVYPSIDSPTPPTTIIPRPISNTSTSSSLTPTSTSKPPLPPMPQTMNTPTAAIQPPLPPMPQIPLPASTNTTRTPPAASSLSSPKEDPSPAKNIPKSPSSTYSENNDRGSNTPKDGEVLASSMGGGVRLFASAKKRQTASLDELATRYKEGGFGGEKREQEKRMRMGETERWLSLYDRFSGRQRGKKNMKSR